MSDNLISNNFMILRIFTSFLLASMAILSSVYQGLLLLLVVLLLIFFMNIEWVKITENKPNNYILFLKIFSTVFLGILVFYKLNIFYLTCFLVVLGIISSLINKAKISYLYVLIGPVYTTLPILLLYNIRLEHNYGLEILIWCLVVTWSTDIFSYVGGKLLKGPKLYKLISPNKTWSGFAVGILVPIIISFLGFSYMGYEIDFYLLWTFLLALSVQAGDLFESLIKRIHGVKDSGRFLPGHGGFLDRLDGFIFCAFTMSIGVYFYEF